MRAWTHSLALFCLAGLAWLGASSAARAAPGELDPAFGIGGRGFATVTGADSVYGEAIAIAPGGAYVVAGRCAVLATLTNHFCVIRVRPDGFFDTSFNLSGNKRIFAAPGESEIPRAVAVQADRKIVIAGQCGPELTPTHMCVVRLLEDGSADDGFGTSGKVKFNFGGSGNQSARAVAMLPDGRILLAGTCSGTALGSIGGCVVRLNANGSVDTSFGNAGRTYIVNTFAPDEITSIAVTPGGKILVASFGNTSLAPGISYQAYVSQLNANGSLDTSFGNNGTRLLPFAGQSRWPRLTLQPDGNILVAAVCANGSDTQCGVRLTSSGQVAAGFAYSGSPVDAGDYGGKALLQADGKIVWISARITAAAGGTLDFQNNRSLDTGAADPTYTGAGSKTMYQADDRANDALIQADDKVVIAGSCYSGSAYHMCLARLQAGPFGGRNCSMDIDGDGQVLATTDALILARVALGLSGAQVFNGIASTGTRNSWPLVRDYLVQQCGMTGVGQ